MNPLLIRRRGMMAGKALPYDAEIEYLESTLSTGQYIDTLITPTAATGIKMEVSCNDTRDSFIAGLRNSTNTNTRWCVGHASNGFYWGYGGYQGSGNRLIAQDAVLEMNYLASGVFTATNGAETHTDPLPTLSFVPNKTICLFIGNGVYSQSYGKWNGKIYYCIITQNNSVVMDLIPVRVGTVGYMYDRVSGQLFGNAGTGAFVLGPDVQ